MSVMFGCPHIFGHITYVVCTVSFILCVHASYSDRWWCVCRQVCVCVCGQLALTGSRSSGQVHLYLCMWRGESVTSLSLPPSFLLPPSLS